jgi:hypothetical protein
MVHQIIGADEDKGLFDHERGVAGRSLTRNTNVIRRQHLGLFLVYFSGDNLIHAVSWAP